MTRRALAALGIGQCVNWGVLYYAFAILVLPLAAELGVATWVVTGAFSLALLMSAAVAPAMGRWADQGRGPAMMQAGGIAAAALLGLWTLVPGVVMLYVVWAGLGLCMAATLYEPAFVIVGRAYDDPPRRLRALAAVTLFGGLASTVFLPLTALMVSAAGWRGAALALAVILAVTTGVTRVLVFRHLPPAAAVAHSDSARQSPGRAGHAGFPLIAAIFALVSLAGAAFVANLVPALGERGIAPETAAVLGGAIGVMQLPGRALLLHGAASASPSRLLTLSLLFMAGGLGAVAAAASVAVAAAGTMLFGLGAGLTTLVRPYLVQMLFSDRIGGYLNGRVARQQQLARAAGPLAMAWLAGVSGYTPVLAVVAGGFVAIAAASHKLERWKSRPLGRLQLGDEQRGVER
jgi:MFS family permease